MTKLELAVPGYGAADLNVTVTRTDYDYLRMGWRRLIRVQGTRPGADPTLLHQGWLPVGMEVGDCSCKDGLLALELRPEVDDRSLSVPVRASP